MKNLLAFIVYGLLSTIAFAGLPPVSITGQNYISVLANKITAAQINLGSHVTGSLPYLSLASSQVNKYLYADCQRTDSYTADGSQQRPFKTIGAVITQIIANADNSTHPYTIFVAPGACAETLSFNSTQLVNLTFSTLAAPGTAVQNTSVTGITSTSNNTQLANLVFVGITVNGNLNLTGDVNGSNMCSTQCLFSAMQFNNSSGTITLNNVNNVSFYNVQIQGSGSVATFTNVAMGYITNAEGFLGGTTLHLVDNPGGNVPSQYSGNYLLMAHTKYYGTMTIDAGSELDTLFAYFGTTSVVTNNGIIHSWNTGWAGTTAAVFNSGSTYRNRGDTVWTPHVFNSSSPTNQDYVYMLGGVFGTTAVPATNAAIVTKDGHIKSTQTTAPTATVNANAGTGATCAVANATDTTGKVTIVTGSIGTPTTGTQCTINFNKAYGVAPICTFSPANVTAGANLVQSYVNVPTTAGLPLAFGVAGVTTGTYVYMYTCLETQ